MQITSVEFIFLIPIVILLYWVVPNKLRLYYLLLINILFYASFGAIYLLVVICEAVIAYYFGKKIYGTYEIRAKKHFCAAGIIVILLPLLFFKVGGQVSDSLIAPLGISFFTLQAISYVVDVKRGLTGSEKNFFKLLTYLSFFTTITSGPIYRYKDFKESSSRIETGKKPDYDTFINSLVYVLYGYFLKLIIAGRAGTVVDTVYSNFTEADYGGIILAATAVTYSIQIYADFAGYSAIVIGIAKMLDYDIPENFCAPYFSESIKEFWRRWHISLSSWLKDYIYIPLGGNRKGKIRQYVNILLTFAVSGIWHGISGFNYLIWGLLHGAFQIVGDILKPIRQKLIKFSGIVENSMTHKIFKKMITFMMVTLAWIFFRLKTSEASDYIVKMFSTVSFSFLRSFPEIGLTKKELLLLILSIVIMAITDIIGYRKKKRFDEIVISQGVTVRWAVIVFLALLILVFGEYGPQHDAAYFIYRDF